MVKHNWRSLKETFLGQIGLENLLPFSAYLFGQWFNFVVRENR